MQESGFPYNFNSDFDESHNQNYENYDFLDSKFNYNQFCNQFMEDSNDYKMLVYQIFNFHSAVMLLVNPNDEGKIVLANYAASLYYGYSQNELQSMKISDINIMHQEYINNEMDNAKKFQRNYFIFKHRLANGSIRDVEVFSTPVTINNNSLLFSIIHDITEKNFVQDVLKQTNKDLISSNNDLAHKLVKLTSLFNKLKISEHQLTDLNSRKDKFFMIISHDMKALLYTLLQYTNIIKNDFESLTTGELYGLINLVFDSVVNLDELLVDLVNWSNIQTGKFELRNTNFKLRNVIDTNIELFELDAYLKKIIFENRIDPDYSVCTDINILNTILRNLISNAIKFSKQNGVIKIWQYDSNNEKTVIVIEDNGIGMNEAEASCLFRIDKILRSYGTSGEVGTGMGLVITKDLIDICGEEIWLDSIPDSGSRFYFTLTKSK